MGDTSGFRVVLVPAGQVTSDGCEPGWVKLTGTPGRGTWDEWGPYQLAGEGAFERPLAVGDVLAGYCDGWFGDVYGDKTVEAIGGDWVVARHGDAPVLYHGDPQELCRFRER